MLRFMLLTSIMFMSCCGSDYQIPMDLFVENDGRYHRYRAFFEEHTGHQTDYIPIASGEAGLAYCTFREYMGRRIAKYIVVNKTRFDELSPWHRRAIIAHELIHCHLDVEHTPQTGYGEYDLMSPLFDTDYPLDEEELIEQLQPYVR